MKNDAIWLVWARRGDYSDRTEYAVCWFPTAKEAEACAATMQAESNKWRSRLSGSDNRWTHEEVAKQEIGDSDWSCWDDTTYSAFKLTRGAK